MRVRRGRLLISAVAVFLLAAFAGPVDASAAASRFGAGSLGKLSADEITKLAGQADQRSIIVLKNQHSELPAVPNLAARRSQAVDSDQAGIKSELSTLRATDVKSFHIVNAVSATISRAEARRLASDPAVRAVVPDLRRPLPLAASRDTTAAAAGAAAQPSAAELQQICPPDPSVPLLEPEALQVMNVEFQPGDTRPAAHQLADGSGVKVGIIADGLDPNQPDLIRNGKSIVFDFRDFSGYGNNAPTDGRESFLDAGAIAAQGNAVYDLAKFVNPTHPLPPGCNIRIKGVAPGASLAVMNVAGSAPGFFNSQIIQGIEWAVNVDRVNILNESIGGNSFPDKNNDPVTLANENAVAAGVTVVASSGDAGPTNTIGSPASDPGIINVGGSTTYRVYRQATRYGVQLEAGGWESNNITALSSAGTTQFGPRTIDVVAPGDRGWELCSADIAHFFGCADFDNNNIGQPIWAAGGTSLSCPLTSGTAALVIQAYGKTHNGAKPSPALIKRIIVSTAQDLGAPAEHQGAGLVNTLKAVQLAESIHDSNGSPAPQGNTITVSKTSLISTAPAGSPLNFQFDVTNTGAAAQTVSPSVVSLGANHVSDDRGSVNLSSSSPIFIDDRGRPSAYQIHQFTVPNGVDYLNGDIVWNAQAQSPGGKPGSVVFETVWDPAGRVAAYSLLNEASGHGHIEVRKPAAGTWTTAIWTVKNATQYTGEVRFDYFTQRFQPAGAVTPAARTLQPGQTAGFTVSLTASGQAGDRAASVRLSTGGPGDGALPIVVRSLVPMNAAGGTFRGTLTGGASPGQQFTYQFDVPAGKPSLDLAFSLRDRTYPMLGFLIDPFGQPLDVQSTFLGQTAGGVLTFGRTMQFFEKTPMAGRWAIIAYLDQNLDAIDPNNFTEPFTGRIDFQPVPVVAKGLPNSAPTVLPQGKPATATIQVTNSGNSTKDFFVDPRLSYRSFQQVLGYQNTNVPLPLSLTTQPFFFVPPNSDLFAVVAQGTVPLQMEISPPFGGPDLLGTPFPGNFDVAVATAPELAPTQWFAVPEGQGPFPPNGIGNATVNLAGAVNTNAFDPAVTSSTGDAWLQLAIDNTAPYTPLTLNPGQTGTITVTVTPHAPKGTVVHGFIEVETFNGFTASGDEVVSIPYAYKVG
ncbi:S8 family serine peptidase [Candidatus Nephthysia bennettiae]|uniref:S8 family serine peptidase n=1 Tax=Candidatus Nephthysia bennettiae TaxID=3127016 RepID=A0A934JY44_9BACT|nr:S8 family serine peptidase [Candidatus Dormibacteraeota bacterium]MBJ7612481.1 S8 family serine peptidase [Candidatus Dormibacteraeota bacterium]